MIQEKEDLIDSILILISKNLHLLSYNKLLVTKQKVEKGFTKYKNKNKFSNVKVKK